LIADAGSLDASELEGAPYLQVLSMSGLQVDFYNDYIGGEVRLAYYHDGTAVRPVTGISISGKLTEVLSSIRFSQETTVYGSYAGPRCAALEHMTIF
jgi:PmbA protein